MQHRDVAQRRFGKRLADQGFAATAPQTQAAARSAPGASTQALNYYLSEAPLQSPQELDHATRREQELRRDTQPPQVATLSQQTPKRLGGDLCGIQHRVVQSDCR